MTLKIDWQQAFKRLQRLKFIAIAFLTCAFIISCTPVPLNPLRVTCILWLGYEPLMLARDLGYYDDSGIQVIETEDFGSSVKRFINGDVEMVMMSMDLALENVALQDDIRGFLVATFSSGADAVIVQPEIETLSDLKGKRIGMLPGTLGQLVTSRALETVNLTLADVEIVTIDIAQQVAAFENKEVDALAAFDPVLAQLQTQGLGNILFDSSQMPGELVDLLIGRASLVDTHERQLQTLLRGWFKALDYIETNPDDAIARIAKRENLTPEQVERTLAQLDFLDLTRMLEIFNKTDTETLSKMKTTSQFLKEQKILETAIDPATILEDAPLSQL
ncbi:ABC transporter substrate-binding protein [Roseofilum casamattae]|uniref:ABC transporter substrate-binding protein n=1 Tax=Roseofilum casamattae BLCC-M143 TaxID=3022442 RepID=A0ABT7BUV7_9CYAN|nr:ABC transporter substrate-binding protein [Roseofilum casamattae]MDJ1182970.1 ABC transporter substrate-binding protein [Roseofilum casamattae BLCC-M143]